MSTLTINKASKRQLFGFSFNNASTNSVLLALSIYFLIYCTSYYKMSPITVGLIMTGTRIFDGFTDPLIGILIDKTDTKFGRFRPWILTGSLISASSFMLMFSGIKTGSNIGNLVLIVGLYILFIIGYTMQTACTKSAQTILTSVKNQRTILNAFGMLWSMFIYAFIMVSAMPLIMNAGGTDVSSGWRLFAIVIGIIQIVFAIIVVISLRSKDVRANYIKTIKMAKPKIKDYFHVIKHNKALQMLIVAASTNKIAQTLQTGMIVVFYFYVAKNISYQRQIPIIIMILTAIFMFLSVRVISKYGRVEVFKWSSIFGFIFGLLRIPLIAMDPSNFWWLVILFAINTLLAIGTTDQNLISMIADTADYEYYINKRFIPGMIGTCFSFVDKIVSSLSSTLVGVVLGIAGFVSIEVTPQSPKMFWIILITYSAVPAIGHLFSVIGMHYHPLKHDVHEKMIKELAKRDFAEV